MVEIYQFTPESIFPSVAVPPIHLRGLASWAGSTILSDNRLQRTVYRGYWAKTITSARMETKGEYFVILYNGHHVDAS